MLRKIPGLASEIYLGGVRWRIKEAPSTTGITSATDDSSRTQFSRLLMLRRIPGLVSEIYLRGFR